jgi:uncharacterized protein (DUF1330 family)
MAAYAIGFATLRNTDWQQEYTAHMPALTAKHGGKLMAKSAPQPLEGSPVLPEAMVVIEFPSAAHAQAWYEDPEHTRLKALRQSGADFSMVLVGA